MRDNWENIMGMAFALGALLIFALALGQIIDNQAARSDPSSEYTATKQSDHKCSQTSTLALYCQ